MFNVGFNCLLTTASAHQDYMADLTFWAAYGAARNSYPVPMNTFYIRGCPFTKYIKPGKEPHSTEHP